MGDDDDDDDMVPDDDDDDDDDDMVPTRPSSGSRVGSCHDGCQRNCNEFCRCNPAPGSITILPPAEGEGGGKCKDKAGKFCPKNKNKCHKKSVKKKCPVMCDACGDRICKDFHKRICPKWGAKCHRRENAIKCPETCDVPWCRDNNRRLTFMV